MRDIVIFGNNDFACLLKYYIDIDDVRKVVAFMVTENLIKDDIFCGLKVEELND